MIDKEELENILICPLTQEKLNWLTPIELEQLNQRILNKEIKRQDGRIHPTPLQAALQTRRQDLFYPVEEDIFYLLPDCALTSSMTAANVDPALQTKRQVKHFYDEIGWQSDGSIYQDARDSEDLRSVSQEYILQCHLRVSHYLPKQGKYLLDVASGPIQYQAYLSYSKHFDYRICADISLRALKEAKKKLGPKGIYLLCDITRLPLKENSVDAVVSLHTLYHVPQQEQLTAFAQLYRVLKPGGTSVVVYSWGAYSLLMTLFLWPLKLLSWLKRKLMPGKKLYFHANNYRWFCNEIKANYPTQLYSWRSVNVPFMKIFIHPLFGGRQLLRGLFWLENHHHELLGRIGAYPMFVSIKQ